MVCVPCILLPIVLAIYIRFIQPIVFRLLPESWRVAFDAVMYPTCRIPNTEAKSCNEDCNIGDQSAAVIKEANCFTEGDSKKYS
ncbi:unnamed protein product [Thelazia callipaeda]|uniref:UPF0729 protein C18orf32 homolog n=1 Tax=Thelazia callipaeda TaxID=103827 RepID=A0A0N5D801_THECL|nr:unnamed protein product [Thelazia callipaeda]